MATFRVLREHLGDRMYKTGEDRVADGAEVEHLVKAGILLRLPEKSGQKSSPENKSRRAAPKNKGGQE